MTIGDTIIDTPLIQWQWVQHRYQQTTRYNANALSSSSLHLLNCFYNNNKASSSIAKCNEGQDLRQQYQTGKYIKIYI